MSIEAVSIWLDDDCGPVVSSVDGWPREVDSNSEVVNEVLSGVTTEVSDAPFVLISAVHPMERVLASVIDTVVDTGCSFVVTLDSELTVSMDDTAVEEKGRVDSMSYITVVVAVLNAAKIVWVSLVLDDATALAVEDISDKVVSG